MRKKSKTKIVTKQGCAALKSKNGPRSPLGGSGAGFLVSGDLPIMPQPNFWKKNFALGQCGWFLESHTLKGFWIRLYTFGSNWK